MDKHILTEVVLQQQINWASKDASEVVSNYVTAAPVIIGGIWILWKWGFSEWLRRQKEIPSVEGSLAVDELHPKPEIVHLTLNATWKNNSGLPVWIDHLRTRVDLYSVPDDLPVGAIRPKEDLGNPLDTIRPFEYMDQYMLEPNASETT